MEVVVLHNFSPVDAASKRGVDAQLAWDLKYQIWLLTNIIGNDTSLLETTRVQLQQIA